jgi:hypothetical protein
VGWSGQSCAVTRGRGGEGGSGGWQGARPTEAVADWANRGACPGEGNRGGPCLEERGGEGASLKKSTSGWAQDELGKFLFIQNIFYQFKFQMVQRISSRDRNFLNKIWISTELNMKQLSLLELSNI